ncbi:DUF6249 domain-containing protein [Aurantibacter sp.]|uniref:DUF6249 domain-containing protein n=1 Tax=Aurantibacter sp. TaxID=2807103 RepID=UPI00326786CB
MAGAVFMLGSIALAVFGISYLFFTTRNKERLALIEKGADASIFMKGKNNDTPMWKVILLNLSVLLISIGIGIFIGAILSEMRVDPDVAYPGTIFILAGIGLLVGFYLTKKIEKQE